VSVEVPETKPASVIIGSATAVTAGGSASLPPQPIKDTSTNNKSNNGNARQNRKHGTLNFLCIISNPPFYLMFTVIGLQLHERILSSVSQFFSAFRSANPGNHPLSGF
jgi:hypothetical protein